VTSRVPQVSGRAAAAEPRFLILGAGMSGILAAIKLQEAGHNDFVIYEKADRLGGTWRENTYPGIACDVPSHMYCYSFAPNPEWSHRFSPGAEIQAYFEGVAERFGVAARIQFGREVRRCAFEDGRWRITLDDGGTDEGDFVIAATGVLHHPNLPHFEGLEDFEGAAFHSARFDHDVDLAGKRVGVVGTGSSAIQIVSALAEKVGALVLFQRTAQWIMPAENPAFGEEAKAGYRSNPAAMAALREQIGRAFVDGFANILGQVDSPALLAMHQMCEANLDNSVKDPVLRERLRPNYRAACKRLVMSDRFYDAVQQPNVRVVTEAIDRVEESGIRCADGALHELDVLILATGFRVDRFMRPMEVIGRDGVNLDEAWGDNPTAYMAIAIPEFPNLFMLNGPNGPVGNFSLIDVAEMQFGYIMQLVDEVRSGDCREIAVSAEAMNRFDEERREAAKSTIWNSGCRSWYIAADGLPMAWPWTFDRFREEMATPRLRDYEKR
jgi:cation diffusion facilitator CzcD-associated flavoprotein CzcO